MRRSGLWVAAIVLSCSGNTPPTNTDAPPPNPEPTIEAIAAAQCRKILECCAATELEAVLGPDIADQAGCEDAIVSQAQAFFLPSLERALDEGTIRLDEGQVSSCTGALEARSCGDFEPVASADVLRSEGCTGLVVPRLTLSGFCTDDFECDTGFCSHPPADTDGTCKNPPQIGEPCLHERCDGFLACSPDGTCVEKLGEGEVCTRNADCRSDVCSPDDTGEIVCQAVPQVCSG